MKWLVKLKQPGENEEDWKAILEALPVIVKEEDGEVYFSLNQFEQAADVHEVKEKAEDFLLRVNRGLSAAPGREVKFEATGYFEVVEEEGRKRKRQHIILETAGVRLYGYPLSVTSSSLEKRAKIAQSYVLLALEDDRANVILALLDQEMVPVTLYNIYEGIVKDMGDGNKSVGKSRIDQSGWATEDELNTFQHSVQVREVVGLQARHVFADWEPPESPMSISEMESLIRRLSNRWLKYKATRIENR